MIDQLTAAGFSVVALERGPYIPPNEFDDDELRNSVRALVFSPNQQETFRHYEDEVAKPGKFADIGQCIGGSMTHWAGWAWRRSAFTARMA